MYFKQSPFTTSILHNIRFSPVGLVPQKDGSYMLINHLSYPAGLSLNDLIESQYCSVRNKSFETALDMLSKFGRGALVTRLDIKRAFRVLPIKPSDLTC